MKIPILNRLQTRDRTKNLHSVSGRDRTKKLPSVFNLIVQRLVHLCAITSKPSKIVANGNRAVTRSHDYLVSGPLDVVRQRLPDRPSWLSETHLVAWLRTDGSRNASKTGDSSDDETPGEENIDRSDVPTTRRAESLLFRGGVIGPCEQGNDFCLNDEFRAEWHDRIESLRDDDAVGNELANEFDISPSAIEFEYSDGAVIAHGDSGKVGHWGSRAAMIADVAAGRELPDWVDAWDDVSGGLRGELLFTVRIFLDVCPLCDDAVRIRRESIDSDDGAHEIFGGTCEECDARVFELPVPEPA